MSYTICIVNRDIASACDPPETILDAAERAGFTIPYSCRKGVCSSGGFALARWPSLIWRERGPGLLPLRRLPPP